MIQPKYSPQEALERVKLMMKYDMGKTLNENRGLVAEQATNVVSPGEASKIAEEIFQNLAGDVESEDIGNLQTIFDNQIFGKTFRDGTCLLNTIIPYYKKSIGNFTLSLGGFVSGNLIKDISDSIEMAREPEFDVLKKDLLDSINKELNGFCKTHIAITPTPDNTSKIKNSSDKTSYPACVQVFGEPTTKQNGITSINGTGRWDGYVFFNTGRAGTPDNKMVNYSCVGNEIKIETGKKDGGGYVEPKIPAELGNREGVMNFQNWLDKSYPGWATGYQGGVLLQGKNGKGYGSFGPRTTRAWAAYGKEFLSGGKTKVEEPQSTPGEESVDDVNNG